MKILFWVLITLLACSVGFAVWVRVAPFDQARWHIDPAKAPDRKLGWFKAELVMADVDTPEQALAKVGAVAVDWPRTKVLFGDAKSGRISFVTRTKFWQFPDVTTVSAVTSDSGVVLQFYARQRFGGDDVGVNRARIKAWLGELEPK